nr:hypothetical protein CFP56_53397 [Quercus suber]
MDAITTKYANIKLSDRERSEVNLAPSGIDQGLVLAGKFYTKRRVNLEAIGRALRSMWRTKKDFEVSDVGDNRVLFSFQAKAYLDRVFLQGPWSFDKYILLLRKLKMGESVSSLTFHEAAFWVEKVDVGDKGLNLACYLRIRVMMDISQPLIRGRLDHDEKECIEWMRRADPIKSEDKQYGPWLRATPNRLQKSHTVMGQLAGERASYGQMGEEMTEGMRQPGKQTEASVERRQTQRALETNEDRADVESMILQDEKFKEKLTGDKEKLDFKEQLREIDIEIFNKAEIFSKADLGGNVQKVPKVRILEPEKKGSVNR